MAAQSLGRGALPAPQKDKPKEITFEIADGLGHALRRLAVDFDLVKMAGRGGSSATERGGDNLSGGFCAANRAAIARCAHEKPSKWATFTSKCALMRYFRPELTQLKAQENSTILSQKNIDAHLKLLSVVLAFDDSRPKQQHAAPSIDVQAVRARLVVAPWMLVGLLEPEEVIRHWCAFPSACLASTGPRGRAHIELFGVRFGRVPPPGLSASWHRWASVLLHMQWARAMPALQPTPRGHELHSLELQGHTRLPMNVWARGWRRRIFGEGGGDEGIDEGGDVGAGDAGGDAGGGGEGGGGGCVVNTSLHPRTAAHLFDEAEMVAFYELMEQFAYKPPNQAVEALASRLGMTAAVACTSFVRKELAALAMMAQTRVAQVATDHGRAAGALAQRRRALRLHALGNVQAQAVSVRQALAARVAVVADAATANDDDDEGVEGGAGDKRALPRAPTSRLTAEELRSALGVRCCEGSPLFPKCVLPIRASGGARACFLCAPPKGPEEC